MGKCIFGQSKMACVLVAFCLVSLGVARAASGTDYVFTVDQSQSGVQADVTPYYGGSTSLGTESSSSSVTGTISATLDPGASPFGTIRITAMDLQLPDGLNYSFASGLEVVSASNVSLALTPGNAGPQTSVAGSGDFTQIGNIFEVSADVNASGIITGSPSITNQPTTLEPLDGDITQLSQMLTVHLVINQSFNDILLDSGSGTTADIVLTGDVYGTATVIPEPASLSVVLLGGLALVRRRRGGR